MSAGQILFIDAYDSFSNNIITLLQKQIGAKVDSIKIDDDRFVLNDDAFYAFLDHYDAVVAGPGPGHPACAEDVGLVGRLWCLPNRHTLPVLGICLGFQSLCLAEGTKVLQLKQPRHGLVTSITHHSKGIFAGVEELLATQYHSLHVQIPHGDEDQNIARKPHWETGSDDCNVLPLAWDISDAENGPILMAAQHRSKPYVGVQFHPESICTNEQGGVLISNWWAESVAWNKAQQRPGSRLLVDGTREPGRIDHSLPDNNLKPASSLQYRRESLPPTFDVVGYLTNLRQSSLSYQPILLQSGLSHGLPVNSETGRYSIIGFHDEYCTHLRYSCDSTQLAVGLPSNMKLCKEPSIAAVYAMMEDLVIASKIETGPPTPFWGGFIGFISYEAGLKSIEVVPSKPACQSDDMWFVLVERSIVVDHVEQCAYVQSLRPNDKLWLEDSSRTLKTRNCVTETAWQKQPVNAKLVYSPPEDEYCDKIQECEAHLRAGSSYELCLTDQTLIAQEMDAWSLYTRLSKLNPAPFGTYLRLQDTSQPDSGVSIVGSSPERFLNWSRNGRCQFRPIKGTMLKSPGTTKAEVTAVLKSKKEQAENLMIVDLIRHDLAGVSG